MFDVHICFLKDYLNNIRYLRFGEIVGVYLTQDLIAGQVSVSENYLTEAENCIFK